MLEGQCLKDIDHRLLVRKIILSRFLEMPLERYEEFIENLKINSVFIKLYNRKWAKCDGGIIKIINFPGTMRSSRKYKWSKNVLAEVIVSKDSYLINYRNEWFSKEIVVNQNGLNWFLENEKLISKKTSIRDLLTKIRLINIRNSITYKILGGIIYFQKDFFINRDDPYSLKVLSFLDVSKWVSDNFKNGLYIDSSRISRIISRKLIITKYGHEIELKELFPSSRDIKKKYVKKILYLEHEGMNKGILEVAYNDGKIANKIKVISEIDISRRTVGHCRKELGVVNSYRRIKTYYPPINFDYSRFFPFNDQSVKKNAPKKSGVYELSTTDLEIVYREGRSKIFYLGSTKDIKKRLLEHLGFSGRNGGIKNFLKGHSCLFRYKLCSEDWNKTEKELYNSFIVTFREAPKCNTIKP